MGQVLDNLVATALNRLKSEGAYRERPVLQGGQAARVRMDDRDVIMLSSTNYLGLAEDPRIAEAAIQAIKEFGVGTAAGPRLCGVTSLHTQLEEAIADFLGTEAALLYTSAYMANLGLLGALAQRDDIIFSDQLNHASIIDACRFSRARIVVYPHNDMDALESLLQERRSEGRNAIIVADGVFSMDGTLADVPRLVQLASDYRAITVIDDAHGTGVVGPAGRGTPAHFNTDVDAITSTLGKALGGGIGGFVAGSKALIDFLIQQSRAYRFTNTLPPASVASAAAALDLLRSQGSELIGRLYRNGHMLRSGLADMGYEVMGEDLPMVPILIRDDHKAVQMHHRLLEEGVFVQAYAFPVVPKGTARLRCIATATHTETDLQQALDAFRRVGREAGIIQG